MGRRLAIICGVGACVLVEWAYEVCPESDMSHLDADAMELGSGNLILKSLICAQLQSQAGIWGLMAYYCEDCRHKVGSIASAKVHRRFGHTVTLLEPSPPARETREMVPVEPIGEFHFHHEVPFANLVPCTGPHPNLPSRAPRQVTV
jgi:hypothetical protein